MTISVAMCTYNGAAFLRDQLSSIAAQTRLPDEMVVCDDCSSDGSTAILETFVASAPFPVRVYRNPVNLGSDENFEQSIRLCQGDIIALADQDDIWLPEKIAKIEVEFANPAVGLVFSDAEVVDDGLNPVGLRLWDVYFPQKSRRQMQAGQAFQVQLDHNVVTGATMAFRSEFRPLALPIPHGTHLIHDGWIALVVAAVSRVVALPEPLIFYRRHAGQQVGVAPPLPKNHRLVLSRRHYARHLLQLEEVARRLATDGKHRSDRVRRARLSHIQGHARHLRTRLGLPAARPARGLPVLAQLFSGQYHRYSNGFRSAARDLLYPMDVPEREKT